MIKEGAFQTNFGETSLTSKSYKPRPKLTILSHDTSKEINMFSNKMTKILLL